MKATEPLQAEINNVESGFDVLMDEFRDLQKGIKLGMHEQVDNQDYSVLKELIEFQKTAEDQMGEIIKIKKNWNTFLHEKTSFDSDSENLEEDEDEIEETVSAIDRTSWKIVDDVVRIETVRPNNGVPYTNNIPVGLFRDIVLTCIDQFERYEKTVLKTSYINTLMKEKIIKESSYKKATKAAIYAVFKVLLRESMLSPYENMKRAYTLNNHAADIRSWLNTSVKEKSN